MDAGKARNLQMALWDALVATRAAPTHLGAEAPPHDPLLPGAKGVVPNPGAALPKIDLPVVPRVLLSLGGYSVNLSAAAVAASHEPVPRLRGPQPAAVNDPKAPPKPTNAAAPALRAYVDALELSTEDGILRVSNVAPRAPAAIDVAAVAPPFPPAIPEAVRLPRGAYAITDEFAKATLQPPAAAAPALVTYGNVGELRTQSDIATATGLSPKGPAAPDVMPGAGAVSPASPETLVRIDAPPAYTPPAAFAAAAQLAAAEEAKAAARLLPRPAGELMQQLLPPLDSPAPTPEFYRLVVGAAALGALLLLFL